MPSPWLAGGLPNRDGWIKRRDDVWQGLLFGWELFLGCYLKGEPMSLVKKPPSLRYKSRWICQRWTPWMLGDHMIHDPICRWGSVFWFLFFEIKMMILNTCMEHKRNFNTNRRETNSHAQSSFWMKLSKSYVSSPWLSVLNIWWFQETLRILWRCLCTAPMSCCWAGESPFGIRDTACSCSETW